MENDSHHSLEQNVRSQVTTFTFTFLSSENCFLILYLVMLVEEKEEEQKKKTKKKNRKVEH